MSQDAKNSIAIWVGALAVFGLLWIMNHFNVGASVPDEWLGPIFWIALGLNIAKGAWDFLRSRRRADR